MDEDLAFREARLSFGDVVKMGAAGAVVYGAVAMFGVAAVIGLAGLTVGYLFARTTKY